MSGTFSGSVFLYPFLSYGRSLTNFSENKEAPSCFVVNYVYLCLKQKKIILMKKEDFMKLAITLSIENVKNGGGPFGAVIVKDDQVIATGVNRVTSNHDPTAHAEVSAIRSACALLRTFDLSGCDIYTSCEPCPMCLGAIYWAHIDHIYYGNNKNDAAAIGFDDSFIYEEMALDRQDRKKKMTELLHDEALQAFEAWKNKSDKVKY